MASPASLPVLGLPHPLILIPTARITIPVSKPIGDALFVLIQHSESQPLIAAVPLTADDASLHSWGTAARIVRLIKPVPRNPKQPFLLTLHGVSRVRIDADSACPAATHENVLERNVDFPEPEGTPSMESIVKFKASALRLLELLAKDTAQQSKRETYRKVADMLEDTPDDKAAWMADVLIASVNGEYADKLDFLSATNADDRLARATAIFVKQTSITEVSKKIAQSVDESLSKQQKEFFLRQQLSAIQRELASLTRTTAVSNATSIIPENQNQNVNPRSQGSELDNEEQAEVEDMADIKAKIEAMAKDSEERKMGVREWRRLKRIPQGSVEHGVIRNYLEWLTSIPWPASQSESSSSISMETLRDPAFLSNARSQLDADHYGLDKIKKRLIEYLAVVRLKALQADREQTLIASQKGMEAPKNGHPSQADFNANINALFPNHTAKLPTPPSPKPKSSIVKGPILLFIGPPGTGKTSLGQSIARSLNRPFQRISLGGVRDEAEIRGHRRTYVGSGPGLIVQALRKAGRPDPVILLDEIDKVSQSNFHGDPSAALLEVLDPEQNHSFNDHYVNVPIDLSQVLFICTSNSLETMSPPLLDRCEIIQLSGYTYDEKVHIARRFLLPKQLTANGLTPEHLELSEDALMHIATMYTREAGVRSLERAIGGVVRYKAVEWAEHMDSSPTAADGSGSIEGVKEYKRFVETHELEKILGIARWDAASERERDERRGVVYGLVVTGMGEGGILPIETLLIPSGSGQLKLTGSLGDVIKESGELALSWVKTHAWELGITQGRSVDPLKVPGEARDVHLHLPSGAVKKDGPSAGIAMTCAFVSLFTGACVPSDVAMTGEVRPLSPSLIHPSLTSPPSLQQITLRGRVGPVGGIKEKVLGAHRAHIKKVILPWANRKDVEQDVPPEVRNEMQFCFVRTIEEVLEAAFGKGVLGWRNQGAGGGVGVGVPVLESRL
ncbi:ATP-dependent protease La [Cristinia sonorae]|uniref:Lon protease homolog n=1 Tax=Cristinia sonorae TaxID=1940300 RepID=A0A8K0XLE5_9AGAR|nr:ATP-dependent protease La [Cristinia sonorae]